MFLLEKKSLIVVFVNCAVGEYFPQQLKSTNIRCQQTTMAKMQVFIIGAETAGLHFPLHSFQPEVYDTKLVPTMQEDSLELVVVIKNT